jgi:hypothetical protein
MRKKLRAFINRDISTIFILTGEREQKTRNRVVLYIKYAQFFEGSLSPKRKIPNSSLVRIMWRDVGFLTYTEKGRRYNRWLFLDDLIETFEIETKTTGDLGWFTGWEGKVILKKLKSL